MHSQHHWVAKLKNSINYVMLWSPIWYVLHETMFPTTTDAQHKLRAIAVLQRDLGRERQKILDAEKAAVASRTRSKSVSLSPTSSRVPLPGSDADTVMTEPPPSTQMSPPPTSGGSGASSSSAPGRRGSAISLSSLHRPFPHKLDLSATTMRITAEEASLFSSGPLASPVTLAPKSARPSEIPADLMAAFEAAADADTGAVDIDLTVLDNESSAGNNNNTSGHDMNMNMETSLGNSADKPIELDLDSMDIDMSGMSDLFGDAADGTAGLFSPAQGASDLPLSGTNMADGKDGKQDNLGMDILDALSAVGDPNGHDDLFRAFPQSSTQNQTQSNTNNTLAVPTDPSSSSGLNGAPSPGSILASFAAGGNDPTASHADSEASFDINAIESIDLSTVFNPDGSANNDLDFEELMKSGGFGGTS